MDRASSVFTSRLRLAAKPAAKRGSAFGVQGPIHRSGDHPQAFAGAQSLLFGENAMAFGNGNDAVRVAVHDQILTRLVQCLHLLQWERIASDSLPPSASIPARLVGDLVSGALGPDAVRAVSRALAVVGDAVAARRPADGKGQRGGSEGAALTSSNEALARHRGAGTREPRTTDATAARIGTRNHGGGGTPTRTSTGIGQWRGVGLKHGHNRRIGPGIDFGDTDHGTCIDIDGGEG